MIRIIDVKDKTRTPIVEGHLRTLLSPPADGTRTFAGIKDVDAGKTCEVATSDKTHLVYILEGNDAKVSYTKDGDTARQTSGRRTGVYLEPGEKVSISASGTPLTLLLVAVPKYKDKPTDGAQTGYLFDEARLQSLVDEKGTRERTFWVNKEMGLSNSWDLQIGRMRYRPHAYSPRHRHHASKTSHVVPEHFYFIERGTGEVRHDTGALPVGPGNIVLIPAGEWHSLVASDTGFDYIECQAPFDFATSMEDPFGKNCTSRRPTMAPAARSRGCRARMDNSPYTDLKLKLSGYTGPGRELFRNVLFDQLYSSLPRDPQARVQIYNAEIAPGGFTNWHCHNGATFFVALQGIFEAHFQEGVLIRAKAGDVYSEPIAKFHRGHNPHLELPYLCIGIAITPPDREHVTNVEKPW